MFLLLEQLAGNSCSVLECPICPAISLYNKITKVGMI